MDQEVIEKNAHELVIKAGPKGLLQSELWRGLGMNSREGSRIAVKLEKDGLVKRKKELNGGRWTYRLYPNDDDGCSDKIEWNTLENCPCFCCGNIKVCGKGQTITPLNCNILDEWLIDQVRMSLC